MPEITQEKLDELTAAAAKATDLAKAAEDFKKDLFKFKDESKANADKLAAFETQRAEAEQKELAAKQQYKTLYEQEQAAKKAAEEKAAKAEGTVVRYIKQGAVETAALQAGILKEALPDLKLLREVSALEVKIDGQDVTVRGIEDFITEQKKLRPHWFGKAKEPGFDAGGGGSGGAGGSGEFKELEAKAVLELERKDPDAYRKYMAEKMKRQASAKK